MSKDGGVHLKRTFGTAIGSEGGYCGPERGRLFVGRHVEEAKEGGHGVWLSS